MQEIYVVSGPDKLGLASLTHAHVHTEDGYCLKNRYATPCDGRVVAVSTPPALKEREGDQRLPSQNDEVDCQTRAVSWIDSEIPPRREVGIQRYGTALQPRNGRSSVQDLGEELLDAVVYFQQVRAEFAGACSLLKDIVDLWDDPDALQAMLREAERFLMETGWYGRGAY